MKKKKLRIVNDESIEQKLKDYRPDYTTWAQEVSEKLLNDAFSIAWVVDRASSILAQGELDCNELFVGGRKWSNAPTALFAELLMNDKALLRQLVLLRSKSEFPTVFFDGVVALVNHVLRSYASKLSRLEWKLFVYSVLFSINFFEISSYFWERLNDVGDD